MNILSLLGLAVPVATLVIAVVRLVLRRREYERDYSRERAGQREYQFKELTVPELSERRRERYANVVVRFAGSKRALDREEPVPVRSRLVVRVDIGALRTDSAVDDPVPFPDTQLPQGDVWLDVVLSSTDFGLDSSHSTVATRLLLPGDGRPTQILEFGLSCPSLPGPARARLTYYYRDAVVQSQRIDLDVGAPRSRLAVATDFTTSRDLTRLEAISERQRLSVVVNAGPGTGHRVLVRPPGSHDGTRGAGTELAVGQTALQGAIDLLRTRLSDLAPQQASRSRTQLIEDLRRIAPVGYQLFATLWNKAPEVADAMESAVQDGAVLHACRTNESELTLPWSFLYRYPLPNSPEEVSRLPVCAQLERWDGKAALFDGTPRECPAGPHVEDVLCPFGFWGFSSTVEVLTDRQWPRDRVEVPGGAAASVCVTLATNQKLLSSHLDDLTKIFQRAFSGITLNRGDNKETVRKLLIVDQPLVYFYCHGQPGLNGSTNLAVGLNDAISPDEFTKWVITESRARPRGARMWTKPQPLVFINACHSLQISPKALIGYLDALIGGAEAAGVIGTEVRVHSELAAQFAKTFFDHLLTRHATVDSALHAARMEFLSKGNIFGLLYTPYCWADLNVVPAAA